MKNGKKSQLVLIDSGTGGINTACSLYKRGYRISLKVVCDTLFFPYGKKEESRLKERIEKIIKKYNDGEVVIACNTAGSLFPHFLSPIQPIKRFIEKNQSKKIAVIATELIKKKGVYKYQHTKIYSSQRDIIQIENGRNKIFLPKRITQDKDILILGCTHFDIKEVISKDKIATVSSADLLAEEIAKRYQLKKENNPCIEILYTGKLTLGILNKILELEEAKIIIRKEEV